MHRYQTVDDNVSPAVLCYRIRNVHYRLMQASLSVVDGMRKRQVPSQTGVTILVVTLRTNSIAAIYLRGLTSSEHPHPPLAELPQSSILTEH